MILNPPFLPQKWHVRARTLTHHVVTTTIRGLTHVLCRVDDAHLAHVPHQGPLLLVANHVNFLEAPVIYTRLQPRPVVGFAKAETWDNPALGALFTLWGAIPLQRGAADTAALRQGLEMLKAGFILAVAPEGTRSGDGRLQRGHPGIAFLALHSGAPILPIAYYGGERFWTNLPRLRRTDFHIVVGQSFHLVIGGTRVDRQTRQQITDEIMYQMATLLPPAYRGAYADLGAATETYLRFPPGTRSNLNRGGTYDA
ncbi:MAG TPA: 1-acyl-sn-glycerol-3-phosphate acyltransferase [Chloroflexi bacterium]|nr:1-acyl-sn-glycerol-3-phosphate acyltransferase [Chloroflexota bacterium]